MKGYAKINLLRFETALVGLKVPFGHLNKASI